MTKRVLGYCVPWSIAPGERVAVKVSAEGEPTFRARVLRVICGDDYPGGAGLDLRPVADVPPVERPARVQRVACGSYLRVDGLAFGRDELTFCAWVSPWLVDVPQTIASMRAPGAEDGGWSLELAPGGTLTAIVVTPSGPVSVQLPRPLAPRDWYFVAMRANSRTGRLSLLASPHGRLRATLSASGAVSSVTTLRAAVPLMIGATLDGTSDTTRHFNGRLERPRLADEWLDDDLLCAAAAHRPPEPLLARLLGAWDFSQGMDGDHAIDLSPARRHGRFHRLPTRAVRGPDWTSDVHDPRVRPLEYAAVHFHEDDVYDAGWDSDIEFALPSSLPSGYYVVELACAGDVSYASFFVRPPRDRATAPVAFLASTATYLAYANYRFHLDEALSSSQLGYPVVLEPEHVHQQLHPEIGLSTYDRHRDGSGVHFSSRLRPVLNQGPCTDVWNLNADTHLLAWLERIGQPVDVITDEDLHAEGESLLARYRCVLTGSHPEYWSTPMWRGLERHLALGGRLMYLGGNGFYWRVAFHDAFPGALELRRGLVGARYWSDEPGEHHLQFTGEPGGLWRAIGTPPEALVGVGTRAIGFESSAPYRLTSASRDPRVAFLFEGLAPDAALGEGGYVGGAAAGSELDASSCERGTPRHALVVAVADGLPASAQPVPEDVTMCHRAQGARLDPRVRAEIVFFETPAGGAVLSVGSVAFVSSLPWKGGDNSAARFTANALRRFLDPRPFAVPEDAA